MKKSELLKISPLLATDEMIRAAAEDIPKATIEYFWGREIRKEKRKYKLFMCCTVQNSILKAALYDPDVLRLGGRSASFEVFVDRDARSFITYDRVRDKWLTAKLDRLEWPQGVFYHPAVWLSDADADIIPQYLGSQYAGYNGILSFQREIREETLVRKYKAKTALWDKDMALTPKLPRDWLRWVDRVGIREHFIFYDYQKRGAKTGYCTCCGKEVPIKERPYHNKKGRCACCRHEITYKANGRAGSFCTGYAHVYLLQRRLDGCILREFWASRRYISKEDRKTPNLFCHEIRRIIYDSQLKPRIYYWWDYKQRGYRWSGEEPGYYWGFAYGIYLMGGAGRVYGKTIPGLMKSALRTTGVDVWLRRNGMDADPHEYLTAIGIFPPLERIMKANLPRLFDECFAAPQAAQRLLKCPQASQLTKALGIDTRQLGRLRNLNGGCNLLDWLQKEKEWGRPVSQELIDWFTKQGILAKDIDFIWGKMTPVQIYNYLNRQAEESRETIRQTLIIWQDYLSMAEQQGIDTRDEIVFRTRRLRQRNDELMAAHMRGDCEKEAERLSRKFPHVNEICQSLKKYEYEDGEYAVVAPTDIADVLVDSSVLHHCVRRNDRYLERMEQHESYLLFLRKTHCIGQPYYTMEIEPDGTVRQARTIFSRHESDFEDVKQFLKQWQTVIEGRLSKNDRNQTVKSKALRLEEFEQLRKNDVRINTGDLAGRRLVDVLTADLMEQPAA